MDETFNHSGDFVREISEIADDPVEYIEGDIVRDTDTGKYYKYIGNLNNYLDLRNGGIVTIDFMSNTELCYSPTVEKIATKYFSNMPTEAFSAFHFPLRSQKLPDLTDVPLHPGTDKIYDIVHPCRYLTMYKTDQVKKYQKDIFNRKYIPTDYTWLAHRIENLVIKDKIPHYADNNELHRFLEQILTVQISGFNQVWHYIQTLRSQNIANQTAIHHKDLELRDLPSNLQFYIKIVTQEIEDNYEGIWDINGLPQEHIIATGLCYLPCKKSSQIVFKRPLYPEELSYLRALTSQTPPQAIRQIRSVPLGSLEIDSSEIPVISVFSNGYFHKAEPIIWDILGEKEPLHQTIIAFFLVNPDVEVPDFSNTPPSDIETTMHFKNGKTMHNPILLENLTARNSNREFLNGQEIDFCEY